MAMTKWGRKETIIWPPHSPIYTYGAVFMAVVLTGLLLYCRFTFGNSPLQRFYTPTYIRSSVAGAIGPSRRRQLPDAHGGRSRNSTASGDERRRDRRHDAGTGRQAHPACALAVRVAAAAMFCFTWDRSRSYIDASLSAYLKSAVYGGDSLFDLYKLPLLFGLVSLVIQLPFSIAKDVRRRNN